MRATNQTTLDDLLREIEIMIYRDVFDNIMDADTSDNSDVIRTFMHLYPERCERAVSDAVKCAMEEGASEEQVIMSGYEIPED